MLPEPWVEPLHDPRGERDMAPAPPIAHVSTASYLGTHIDSFHGAVRGPLELLAQGGSACSSTPPLKQSLVTTGVGRLPSVSLRSSLRALVPDEMVNMANKMANKP